MAHTSEEYIMLSNNDSKLDVMNKPKENEWTNWELGLMILMLLVITLIGSIMLIMTVYFIIMIMIENWKN